MHRVPEVIDCWFDSGAMPFAQHHYPFENQELFHKQFPAQFISEAVDQTRGWFYSLLAESTLLFNEPPDVYKIQSDIFPFVAIKNFPISESNNNDFSGLSISSSSGILLAIIKLFELRESKS